PRPDRPSFVYCYCPPGQGGFYAFRPAVLFRDPSMKKYAALMNNALEEAMTLVGAAATFPAVENIEQMSGCIFFRYNEKAPAGQRNMLCNSVGVLRTVRNHDWKKFVESIAPKRTEIRIEGHAGYKVLFGDLKHLDVLLGLSGAVPLLEADPQTELSQKSICFLLPDSRTILIGSEDQFREMLAKGPDARPL